MSRTASIEIWAPADMSEGKTFLSVPGVQDSEARVQDSEARVQDSEARVQDSGARVQDSEARCTGQRGQVSSTARPGVQYSVWR